jgi:hypothetical protein
LGHALGRASPALRLSIYSSRNQRCHTHSTEGRGSDETASVKQPAIRVCCGDGVVSGITAKTLYHGCSISVDHTTKPSLMVSETILLSASASAKPPSGITTKTRGSHTFTFTHFTPLLLLLILGVNPRSLVSANFTHVDKTRQLYVSV